MAETQFIDAQAFAPPSSTTDVARLDASIAGASSGTFVTVYMEEPTRTGQPETFDIYLQLFNADGTENGAPILVNTTTAGEQKLPDVAVLSNGDIVVAWMDEEGNDGDGAGIFLQRYDSTGVAQGSETQVNSTTSGDQQSPTIVALSGGGFAVSWVNNIESGGVFAPSLQMQLFTSAGATSGSELTLVGEASTNNLSFSQPEIIELTGGNLALSWTRFDSDDDAFAQLLVINSSGVVQTGPLDPQVVDDDPFSLPQTRIVPLDTGGFMAVWLKTTGNTGGVNVGYGEVYGRIYDASGIAQGSEIALVTGVDNRRFDIFAAPDGEGGVMVGYVQEAETANERALVVQNVGSDGALLGEPFWINPDIFGTARTAELALLDTGDIVGIYQDGGLGISTQLYTGFLVNGRDARFSDIGEDVALGNTGERVAALEGNDTVSGGTGDDSIGGGMGNDEITGAGGDDVIGGGSGADTITAGPDNDRVLGGGGDDELSGGTGADTVDGGTGADEIDGGSENDRIFGGAGADTIDGGGGNDTIYGFRAEFTDRGPDEPERDEGVTNVINGNVGNDRIFGGEGDDILDGGVGNDTILGDDDNDSPGNDTIIASDGSDTYNGAGGRNLLDYSGITSAINLFLDDDPSPTSTSGEASFGSGFHRFFFFQDVIGTAFNDTILGDDQRNAITAGLGNDSVTTGADNDNLQGQGGADTLSAGDGEDLINGGNDADLLIGGDGADTMRGQAGGDEMRGDDGGDDMSGGIGNDDMSGGADNDVMRGQGNNDTITGDGGEDTIFGGSGNDSIDGGDQDDVLLGQGNNDTLIGNDGSDSLTGAAGSDSLVGGSGDDTLNGGNGADTIDPGSGRDVMNGGAQGDDFVYGIGYEDDRINAYEQGVDALLLDSALWQATNPGLTAQQVIDTFGLLNAGGSILSLDFGGGDVLEIQNSGGITQATLGMDVIIL